MFALNHGCSAGGRATCLIRRVHSSHPVRGLAGGFAACSVRVGQQPGGNLAGFLRADLVRHVAVALADLDFREAAVVPPQRQRGVIGGADLPGEGKAHEEFANTVWQLPTVRANINAWKSDWTTSAG